MVHTTPKNIRMPDVDVIDYCKLFGELNVIFF